MGSIAACTCVRTRDYGCLCVCACMWGCLYACVHVCAHMCVVLSRDSNCDNEVLDNF